MLASNDYVWLSGEYYGSYPGILTVVLDTDRYGSLEVYDLKNNVDEYNYSVLNLKAVSPKRNDEMLHVSTGA